MRFAIGALDAGMTPERIEKKVNRISLQTVRNVNGPQEGLPAAGVTRRGRAEPKMVTPP